jgi:hypothetical protein
MATQVVYENTHWASDSVSFAFAAILLSLAVCLVTGARIIWLNQAKLFGKHK